MEHLNALKAELLSGKRVPEHEKDYRKYFWVKETPKGGISLSYKQEAMDSVRERYGFFVLISNEVKAPVTALRMYRMCDVIECFWEPGKAPIQGEVLKKQEQIYRDLGVEPLLATPEMK